MNAIAKIAPRTALCVVIAAMLAFCPVAQSSVPQNCPIAIEEAQAITLGQLNAKAQAKKYLAVSAFSKKSLIKQLKYEGYSTSEAKYGAGHCGANWKKQCARAAKKYLKIMSFSRSGLARQLRYEGFTSSQVKYGLRAVGY